MTTTITILLVLGLAAWAAWHWYGRYWWAARKWEQEKRKAQARLRLEAKVARLASEAKENADRYTAATIQHLAEQRKRMRDGENLIYDDMRANKEDAIRKRTKRLFDTNSSTGPS